ncbi:LysR family transcriptional regulator [Thalassotalea sp. HSM 43]|uniref:LysR family transcriptional regulator n=1 Tax=Thalassotalea sp. HSM 43 TaxID=2552945 RepID=UPI001081D15A|nr:LysR family transcriptional regulator [Thalassotalea sp. HSM 43]QBY02917.1 LysR family transcriptional regulator [Thalassotalea sp. HSM 43]
MRSIAQRLARIDLNLLVTLLVLLQENNVSRAAEKLFVSQPAVSRALQKLREIFDDPLFARESSGLRPTSRAAELKQPLTVLLNDVYGLIDNSDFDPKTCEQSFTIAIPGLMSHSLLLPVIDTVSALAPDVIISQQPSSLTQQKHLSTGSLDFAIFVAPINEEPFQSTLLGYSYPAIFARKDHPIFATSNPSIDDCLHYKFVDFNVEVQSESLISNPALRYIDDHNLHRQVAFQSGQLGMLAAVMKKNDYLLIGAHHLMEQAVLQQDFKQVMLIHDKSYAVPMYLNDHIITHNSAAHKWLKRILIDELKAVIDGSLTVK